MRLFLLGTTALLTLAAVSTARAEDCRTKFLSTLQAADPAGYGIWNSIASADKSKVESLIECGPGLAIETYKLARLVHESIHVADNELSNSTGKIEFISLSGNRVALNPDARDSVYAFTRGQALKVMSSSERSLNRAPIYLYYLGFESFDQLLDELNAYNHELQTDLFFPATRLHVDSGDAPLQMILFTLRYLQEMEKAQNRFYTARIQADSGVREVLTTLIREGYEITAKSCERPDLHLNDRALLNALAGPASVRQLTALFGNERPVLPTNCAKNAQHSSKKLTPVAVNYPHDDSAFQKNAPSEVKKGNLAYVSTRTETIQPPAFSTYDPKQPSAALTFTRIDNLHLTLSTNAVGVQIVIYGGPKPEENYWEWNGKKTTADELAALAKEHQDVFLLMNNAHIVNPERP